MKTFVEISMIEKILFFLLISTCIFLSIDSAYDGGDFDVYLEAAYKLYHGQNPYLPPYAKDGMGYSYSPFFIMLLIPFTGSYFLTELVWCFLSFFFIYRSYKIFDLYLGIRFMEKKVYMKYIALMILLSYQFIGSNIGMVQVTPFLIWIILESIYQIQKQDRHFFGGVLLGIGINIKFLPGVVLGYLFYRGYFKSFFTALFCFLLLYMAPSPFWGVDYNITLLQDWWVIVNPTNKEHQVETGIGTHSMVAFLPVYLSETIGDLPYRRHIFNLDLNVAIMITNFVNLFLVALSLLYFRSLPFVREISDRKTIWEISYFLLLIPLIVPHQQKYAFLFAIPMVAYILYFFFNTWIMNKTKSSYLCIFGLFAISMIVFSPIHGSDLIGKELFKLSQHYRLITISTLLLIPISLYCRPSKLLPIVNK